MIQVAQSLPEDAMCPCKIARVLVQTISKNLDDLKLLQGAALHVPPNYPVLSLHWRYNTAIINTNARVPYLQRCYCHITPGHIILPKVHDSGWTSLTRRTPASGINNDCSLDLLDQTPSPTPASVSRRPDSRARCIASPQAVCVGFVTRLGWLRDSNLMLVSTHQGARQHSTNSCGSTQHVQATSEQH